MITLELPQERYETSFLEALEEFRQDRGSYDTAMMAVTAETFPEYLASRERMRLGQDLRDGMVAATELWIVDDNGYAGRVSIRHTLNGYLATFGGHVGYIVRPSKRRRGYATHALQLALPWARDIGLDRILVTCDETNYASRRVIERAGGVFEGSVAQAGNPAKLRYWIDLR